MRERDVLCSCLVDSKAERSKFLPRYHSSAIVLYLNSFKFDMGQEVSIIYHNFFVYLWETDV